MYQVLWFWTTVSDRHPVCYVQIYKQTRLNIHPCLYVAYGMTIVEAASQGQACCVVFIAFFAAADLLYRYSIAVSCAGIVLICQCFNYFDCAQSV